METSLPSEKTPPPDKLKLKGSFFKTLFLSPEEPRFRAGWRILFQGVFYQAFAIVLYLAFLFLLRAYLSPTLLMDKSISLAAVLITVFFARRYLDRRSFTSLGLRLNWLAARDLLAGFAITGIIMALIFFLEWSAGWLRFTGFSWQTIPPQIMIKNTLSALLFFSLVAFDEELLSRGYHLQNFADGARSSIQKLDSKSWFSTNILSALVALLNLFTGKKSLLWGSLASSLVFAFLHMANPSASGFAFIGLFAAGLFLAYAYVRTRQLWLPIGLHIGWNFFEGTVFGFPVSGINLQGLVGQINDGPGLITGGAFGPEAGLILIPGLALGFFLVHLYSK